MVRRTRICVNQDLCTRPTECRACLERCPQSVFLIYPRDRREPGKEASDWRVAPAFSGRCTGCMMCVRICPRDAIRLDYY